MKFWNWINGNKSLIGVILMYVIDSDYIAGLIPDPDLYMLAQGLAKLIFGVGLAHKVKKAMDK